MRLFLAAVGVFALAGSASAQYPSPAPTGTGGVIAQNISKHPAAGGYFMSNAAFGDPFRNNAAGSVYSDHAFAFGSTRSFFAPCGPYIGPMHNGCKPLFGRKQAACPPAPCENGTSANK